MARYHATLDTARPLEEVFAYLSDFATTQEWDPGIVRAERVGTASVGAGTEFRLLARFLGRTTPITYRITEYDPPRSVTFVGENAAVVSRDRMTFEPAGGGTRVRYDADLTLKAPLRLADPLLRLVFDRVGDRALAGLERALGAAVAPTLAPLDGRSLDGIAYTFPRDLPKPYGLLAVAFRREQQALVDGWLPLLLRLERERPDVGAYELPVISTLYGPVRRMIDGGMTRGLPDPAARARTITVYTDVGRVLRNLGLPGADTIAVLAVDRAGTIFASVSGAFDEHKATYLVAAIPPVDERAASDREANAPDAPADRS